jgi:hypothetical protein
MMKPMAVLAEAPASRFPCRFSLESVDELAGDDDDEVVKDEEGEGAVLREK